MSLFGDRAAGAAAAIGNSVEAVKEFQQKLIDVDGAAARVAETMDAGIGGSFRRFLSAAEGVAIVIGDALAPRLIALTEYLSGLAGTVAAFVAQNQELIVEIVAGVAAFTAAGVALVVFGTVLSAVGTIIGKLATAGYSLRSYHQLGSSWPGWSLACQHSLTGNQSGNERQTAYPVSLRLFANNSG